MSAVLPKEASVAAELWDAFVIDPPQPIIELAISCAAPAPPLLPARRAGKLNVLAARSYE
jgi:hypothetical protein